MIRQNFHQSLAHVAVALSLAFGATAANAVEITFTEISTAFQTPIGIDHYAPTNEVVMSVNYATGIPYNFSKVAADGTQAQFSLVSGFTDEVKIATVRNGNPGGFVAGDLFVGNGVDGEIARVTNGGGTVIDPFVSLPGGGNGLMRGSLYIDRTGVYGGDLIAVTTAGEVWRINSAGATTPTPLADVNTHLEGLITVPNDAAKYGPLAGKIIAGAEGVGLLYVFDANGLVDMIDVDVNIEDIDLIDASENFFGVNYGTSTLLGAEASQWASVDGDILLTQETGGVSGLFTLSWDGEDLITTVVTVGAGSPPIGQWEHVTFSSAGIVEIPPTTNVPEPTTVALLGLGLFGLGYARRRRLA